jgi:hypothetical protein
MTLAFSGYPTQFAVSDEVPPIVPVTWSSLVEVIELGEVNMERQRIDATSFDPSPWAEQIRGRIMPIVIDMTLNFTDSGTSTQFTDLFDFLENEGNERWYKIIFSPILKQLRFAAFLSKLSVVSALEDQVQSKISLGVTGAMIYEAAV